MLNLVGGSFGTAPGQQAYTTAGSYSWVAPAGVTKVSAVVVGNCDTFGVAGALAYKNNYSVNPGCSYSVFISSATSRNYFISAAACYVSAGAGTEKTGDGGGNGGQIAGGAGGYSGAGGSGVNNNQAGGSGAGGGGGAGKAVYCTCPCDPFHFRGGGGGVGLLGQGTNGAGGASGGAGGAGGSGGTNGTCGSFGSGGNAGQYGGGRGNFTRGCTTYGARGFGAVRIIWPGCARSFPSTRTANE